MMKKYENQKQLNLAIAEKELSNANEKLKSFPCFLSIDVSSECQLKCKFCPTGTGTRHWPKAEMKLKDFKNILEQLGPTLCSVEFGNWGEPLMCKNIFKMIRYAKKYDLRCHLNTNLHGLGAHELSDVLESGLDTVNVTISAINQKTFEHYKRGGSLELVMNNLRTLIEAKAKHDKDTPFIKWQFLVFKHNENEIKQAQQIAKDMGVDEFILTSPWIYDVYNNKDWLASDPKLTRYSVNAQTEEINYDNHSQKCILPWSRITINANGSVFPCCGDIDEEYSLGNILKSPFVDIWNNENFTEIRKYLSGKSDSTKQCCSECNDIKDWVSLIK